MSGRRLAVVVTVEHQDDPVLSRFAVPSADVPVLAQALGDGGLGGFDVAFLHDPGTAETQARITALFEGRDQDDLVLLYFRGIMLTGPGGGLYLAGADTAMARPQETAVDVSRLAVMMQRSGAGQAVVLLDGRTGGPVDAGQHFRAARSAEWQSRVVIATTARLEPPTFAGMIADGIRNGSADRDRDGFVGIGELHDHLRERDPSVRQWVFGSGRQPYLSRIRRPGSDQMTMIAQLAVAAAGADLTRAVEARETLRRMTTGEGRVAAAAAAALRRTSVRLTEPALDFGRVPPGTRQLAAGIPVQGPPLTVASAVTSSVDGLHARLEGSVLKVSWFPTVGRLDGVVTLDGPAGSARLVVTGEVAEELEATGGFQPTPGANGARPASELPAGAGWQPVPESPAGPGVVPPPPVGDAIPLPAAPVASEPVASGPIVSGPVMSGPVVSGPVVSGPVVSEPVASEPVASEPGWPGAAGGGFGWSARPPQPRGPVPAASGSDHPSGTGTASPPPAVTSKEADVPAAGEATAGQESSGNGGPVPEPRQSSDDRPAAAGHGSSSAAAGFGAVAAGFGAVAGWGRGEGSPGAVPAAAQAAPAAQATPADAGATPAADAGSPDRASAEAVSNDRAPADPGSTDGAAPNAAAEDDEAPAVAGAQSGEPASEDEQPDAGGYQGWSAAGSWPTASVAGAAWLRTQSAAEEAGRTGSDVSSGGAISEHPEPEPVAATPEPAPHPAADPIPAPDRAAASESTPVPEPARAPESTPVAAGEPAEEATPAHPWPSHRGVAGDPWLTPPARTRSHPDTDVTDPLPARPVSGATGPLAARPVPGAADPPAPRPVSAAPSEPSWPSAPAASAPTSGWPGRGPGSDDPWAGAGPPPGPVSGAPASPTSGAAQPHPRPGPAQPDPWAGQASGGPADPWTQAAPADPWGQPTSRVSAWPASPADGGWQAPPATPAPGYPPPPGAAYPGTPGTGYPAPPGSGYPASPAAGYPATVRGTAPPGASHPGSPPPEGPHSDPYPEKPRRRAGLALVILLAVAVLAAGSYLGVRLLRSDDNPAASPQQQGQQEQQQQPGQEQTEPGGDGTTAPPPAAEIPASLAKPVVVDRFRLGQEPEGVVVSPDNKMVYVADQNSKDVHFIEVGSRKITKVSVPNTPRFIAISEDGSRLYASMFENDFTGNGLAVIDTKDRKLVKTIRTGPRPFEPAVGPGGDVWLPIHNGARVEIYDDQSLTESGRISVPPNPHWVTFSPDGSIAYTANHESSQISVVNTADRIVQRNIKVGRSPHAIALTPDGAKLIVTNYDLDRVEIFDTATLRRIKQVSVGKEPQAVMTSTDGKHAYVVNEGSDTLSVVDMNATKVVSTVKVGDSPRVVALSPDGLRLYVTDGGGRTVTVLRTTEE
ncbi:beta-propeller fold lactonase family protein [Actinoplanes sp. NPDC023936]|uniref:beta-propeller fold lactonase family protein n=1 Tax=Actinoplanes sp. NPDC023936 TaxID=3154910 RepID=UPI0033F2F188